MTREKYLKVTIVLVWGGGQSKGVKQKQRSPYFAGRVCAGMGHYNFLCGTRLCGNGMYTSPRRGRSGMYQDLCGTCSCGHRFFNILSRDHGIIPSPAQNRGINPAGKIPRNAPIISVKGGGQSRRHTQTAVSYLLKA